MQQQRFRQIQEDKIAQFGGLRVGGCDNEGGVAPKKPYKRCKKTGKDSDACKRAKENTWLQYVHAASIQNPNMKRKDLLMQISTKPTEANGLSQAQADRNKQAYEAWKNGNHPTAISTHHYVKAPKVKSATAKPKVKKVKKEQIVVNGIKYAPVK